MSQIKDFFLGRDPTLSMDEQSFLATHSQEHLKVLGNAVSRYGSLILLVTIIPIFFVSPEPQRSVQMITHGTLGGILFVKGYLFNFFKERGKIFFISLQFTLTCGYAVALKAALVSGANITNIGFLSSLYAVMIIFNILLCPYYNAVVIGSACAYIGLGVWAWTGVPGLKPFDWSIVLIGSSTFAVIMFYARIAGEKKTRIWQYRSSKLSDQIKQVKIDAIEQDLALARKIQNSFETPEKLTEEGWYSAAFCQKKHGTLGGDWLAARTLPNGDIAILVADATGKGVQAALVIHAVQSHWAHGMDDGQFEPLHWINSLNKMLFRLGKSSVHSLTLGLLVLSRDTLAYYSAAHVPIFALKHRVDDSFDVIPIMARGSVLGMGEEVTLMPVVLSLAALDADVIMLGSDGVFERASTLSRGYLTNLYMNFRHKGPAVLNDLKTADDMMLVVIELERKAVKPQSLAA